MTNYQFNSGLQHGQAVAKIALERLTSFSVPICDELRAIANDNLADVLDIFRANGVDHDGCTAFASGYYKGLGDIFMNSYDDILYRNAIG
jgi:hypothetical protein